MDIIGDIAPSFVGGQGWVSAEAGWLVWMPPDFGSVSHSIHG
jgi:hypothetical protein